VSHTTIHREPSAPERPLRSLNTYPLAVQRRASAMMDDAGLMRAWSRMAGWRGDFAHERLWAAKAEEKSRQMRALLEAAEDLPHIPPMEPEIVVLLRHHGRVGMQQPRGIVS